MFLWQAVFLSVKREGCQKEPGRIDKGGGAVISGGMESVPAPKKVELVGELVAILWEDGREDYYPMEKLRAYSPSADNVGEPDLFGRIHGGDPRTEFPGVKVEAWERVGRYALKFVFSDGHQTGLFSHAYLRSLGDEWD